MKDYWEFFYEIGRRYLGRPVLPDDAYEEEVVKNAAQRLNLPIPTALEAYYETIGKSQVLSDGHNHFYSPKELCKDGEYLMIMDENQNVVSWGFQISDLEYDNPTVWQRNNTPPTEWYSEEVCFTEFMQNLFDFYTETEII